jgi:hypothetical protein
MSGIIGLDGESLEQALKEDARERANRTADTGVRAPVSPQPLAAFVAEVVEAKPTAPNPGRPHFNHAPPAGNLPDGMDVAMRIPLKQEDGGTSFSCVLEGFGVQGEGFHASKQEALALALESLAAAIRAAKVS